MHVNFMTFPTANNLHIRAAIIADLPAIQEVAQRTWRPTYGNILSEEQTCYMLEMMYSTEALHAQIKKGHTFIVLERGNEVLGFASFEANHKMEPGLCKLHKLYLLPEEKGKGLGIKLLQEVMLLAKQRGQQRIWLHVNRYNPARDFYLKCGFSILQEEDISIGQGYYMNDYLMGRDLP
jgi:GNAT superfamily N-acetyltransferase